MSDEHSLTFALSGVVVLADDGTIMRADATFARWAGFSAADLAGVPVSRALPARLNEAFLRVGPGRPFEVVTDPGEGFPAAIQIECVMTGTAKSLSITDVSHLQRQIGRLSQSEQMAERESERLQLLLSSSVAFAEVLSLDELGPLLAETARRSFRASASSVHLFDDGEFVLVAGESPLAQFWPDDAPAPGAAPLQADGWSS